MLTVVLLSVLGRGVALLTKPRCAAVLRDPVAIAFDTRGAFDAGTSLVLANSTRSAWVSSARNFTAHHHAVAATLQKPITQLI